ncbi:SIS domain-containing protein [Sinorhizobium alkalisoli]|uniref:Phosphoheptose isomerase n=1 Tax=Sinorhizobium alkalisoli TaxID=1752398 RepID=A0A1E3V4H6_9HYPH|nr:SIS domain-containing protein [Sinorhizobium alkalisoli]ODR88365.1 phosphoheptose isomerase [Sinorhizobium alkalisoli]
MNLHFPTTAYDRCADFAGDYYRHMSAAVTSCDFDQLDRIAALMAETIAASRFIYVCGNGGSAGIANHSLCDFLKCVRTDTDLKPRVMSLSAHTEMNSALANDISYGEVFAYQLESMARPGDMLLTISSSGDSENVVRAIETARTIGIKTVSFTGFGGGRSRDAADFNMHVDAHNYGVVEDMHQSFLHILTQYLRMRNMDQGLVAQRKF